jgi:hypothetical protein
MRNLYPNREKTPIRGRGKANGRHQEMSMRNLYSYRDTNRDTQLRSIIIEKKSICSKISSRSFSSGNRKMPSKPHKLSIHRSRTPKRIENTLKYGLLPSRNQKFLSKLRKFSSSPRMKIVEKYGKMGASRELKTPVKEAVTALKDRRKTTTTSKRFYSPRGKTALNFLYERSLSPLKGRVSITDKGKKKIAVLKLKSKVKSRSPARAGRKSVKISALDLLKKY